MKTSILKSLTRRTCITFFTIATTFNGAAEEEPVAIAIAATPLPGTHSWIVPGQCTPPELWTREIIGTLNPALAEHDKIVFDLGKSQRLIVELEAIDSESVTIDWIWITPSKVHSGSKVARTLHGVSFAFPEVQGQDSKEFKLIGSFDPKRERLALRLSHASPRYALVGHGAKGEQDGADQPATAPKQKPESEENVKPEAEVRPQ